LWLYSRPDLASRYKDIGFNAQRRGEAGVKLFINYPKIAAEPEKIAEHFRNHPALGGYYIKDEPSAELFPQLAETVKRIQSVDSEHPCYINLFPDYAAPQQLGTETYQQHIDRFLAEVPVTFLSFDYYPIWDYKVRESWYENLEIVAKASREKGIPFWAFANVSNHWHYPPATTEHLRFQQFTNLAYGAQTLQYFPYWKPSHKHWYCPIMPGGVRSETYEKVKKVNAEINAVAWVFKGSKVISLGHTGRKNFWWPKSDGGPDAPSQEEGPIPAGTTHYESASPVKKLVAQGQFGVIVSTLAKGNRRFLVVVNKDYANTATLEIEFDGTKDISVVTKDGKIKKLAENNYKELINPAQMTIFSWLDLKL